MIYVIFCFLLVYKKYIFIDLSILFIYFFLYRIYARGPVDKIVVVQPVYHSQSQQQAATASTSSKPNEYVGSDGLPSIPKETR